MEIFGSIFEYVAKVIACFLIIDFLSGLFHWLEDSYGRPNWPVTGRLVTQANILHHYNPRHFTQHSWLASAWILMVIVTMCLGVAFVIGLLNWMTWLVALIGLNANQIHKWDHRTKAENGRAITWIQSTGLLQSRAQHAKHHRNKKDTHHCVITNYLNPLLEEVRFWRGLEWVVYRVTGVRRREDPSVTGQGRNSDEPECTSPSCVREALRLSHALDGGSE